MSCENHDIRIWASISNKLNKCQKILKIIMEEELNKIQGQKNTLLNETFRLFFLNKKLKKKLKELERGKSQFEINNLVLKLKFITN